MLSTSIEHVLGMCAVEAIGLREHGILDPDEQNLFVHCSDLSELTFERRVRVFDLDDGSSGDHIVFEVYSHHELFVVLNFLVDLRDLDGFELILLVEHI
jgi:hypothetical protein